MEKNKAISIHNLTLLFAAIFFAGISCSQENAKSRQIRAHNTEFEGVPHAIGLNHAERYCQHCHGPGLSGGKNLEPSCYTCHGKNWIDSDPTQVHAPANHTNQYGLWFHDPNHNDPDVNCASCHGESLQGESSVGVPSCLLCHDKKW